MRWLIGLLLVAGLGAGAVMWQMPGLSTARAPAATPPAGPAPATVATAPVTVEAVRRQIEAVGTLRSDESVILRPEIAGRVVEILFDEGQKVTKGTPLLRLDAAIAKAQLDQARAGLELSRANNERAEDLSRRGAGTLRARDEALAKLRADEAAVELAQATLDKSTILAPFTGILGLRRVSVGSYVTPGQDLVNIEDIDRLKVDFRIPEIHSQQLALGQAIRVALDAIAGATYDGEVYAIDPAFDPNGRAAILRARLPNRDGKLRSGMFARVTLFVEERQDSITVPETALVPVGQDQFVFRVVNGRAAMTRVETGQRRRGKVEVVSGLDRTAVIVVEGALKLRDGTPVRTAPAAGG